MKKVIAVILTLCIMLSLVGCMAKPIEDADDDYDDVVVREEYINNGNTYSKSESSYTSSSTSSYNASSYNTPSTTHAHTWSEATCTTRKTCTTCGETTGSYAEHNYTAATCSERATCTVCGSTTGSRLEHNYAPESCTTPETCTMCGDTRGSADGHEFFNDTCTKCGEKTTIPFSVEYNANMSYFDTSFTIEQYNILYIDRYSEGRSEIAVTARNNTGGDYFYYHIVFYDASGRVLDESTCGGSKNIGQSETTERFIPKNTVRIVITRAD